MYVTYISCSSKPVIPEDVHLEVQAPFMQPTELLPWDPAKTQSCVGSLHATTTMRISTD